MSGNVCENFVDYFEVMENNTRNNGKRSKKSFHFTDAKIYNELPIKVRNAVTLKDFNDLHNKLFNF